MKRTFIALAAVSLAVACTPSEPPPSEADVVSERAQARWDAVIAADHETAYTFYTPGFRQQTSMVDYTIDMRSRPVQWVDAEVESATCDGDRCTLVTQVEYRVPSAPAQLSGMGNRRPIEETWIRIEENWWFVPGA